MANVFRAELHIVGGGDGVVKLLACGARDTGFEPSSLHFDFRDGYLLLPCHDTCMTERFLAT